MHAALAIVLPTAGAVTGVDISTAVSQADWRCLQSPGGQGPVSFAIPRIYTESGHVDTTGIATVKAARAAGVKYVDGYIFPCVKCGNPGGQVSAAHSACGGSCGMLWLDIEGNTWKTADENQAFIKAMVDECTSLGISCGVYANWNSWSEIVGRNWSYPFSRGLPVWYPHYDNTPSFSDFESFGGWAKPSIKQYIGDHTSCGVGIDYNFYPSGADVRWHNTGNTTLTKTAQKLKI